MLTAKDVMSKKVITVKRDLPIKELSKLFIEHHNMNLNNIY